MKKLTLYQIKKLKGIRIAAFPFVNLVRYTRLVTYQFTKDAEKIRGFKNTHRGERCFIIGNGPSLSVADLEKIKGEYSFAANSIFEIFPKTQWRPQSYLCVDSHVIRDNKKKIARLNVENIFMELEGRKYGIQNKRSEIYYLNNFCPYYVNRYKRVRVKFSDNPAHHVVAGETVVYTAIQLAVYMGFKEIYLLGVDHNYSKKMDAKGNLILDDSVKDYFGDVQTKPYVIQNFETSTNSFRQAKKYCEQAGIVIKNLTRGGKLEIIERGNLEDIIG